MMKKVLVSVLCTLMLLCTVVSAADFKVGDTVGTVTGSYSIPVTKRAAAGGSETLIYPGSRVKVLQAYVTGKGKDVFHRVRLQNGESGYILAYINGENTLEITTLVDEEDENTTNSTETDRNANNAADSTAPVKYGHDIDMSVLSHYIYGGDGAQSGKDCDPSKSLPKEWRMHECPSSLPIVAKAIIHVGDEGELSSVRASFYPGTPSENYHERRLAELKAIGYEVVVPQPKGNANTAFYCMSTSEFDVVAYNDKWVAVWSFGGVDLSRGRGATCMASSGIQYGSWKSGVYFIPRQYCYLLDINNQINYTPETQARGTATGTLMVKTTSDSDDYVKSGVYKINQSFQVVNVTPQNGHYQIYYKKGLYYVDARYVNLQLATVKKPTIMAIAEVSVGETGTALIESSANSGSSVAEAKTGAAIDVLERDCGNGYSKIWFNTQECYIKTEYLTNFQATPSASGLASGAPVGTLAIDSVWADKGQPIYTAEELALLQKTNYGYTNDLELKLQYIKLKDSVNKIWESEWVNVYNVEDFSFYEDPDTHVNDWIVTGKIYTISYGGNVRYIVQLDNQKEAFTYYPGGGYSKNTMAKTQAMYVDTDKYDALAYNIEGNNYFKLRDITDALDCRVEWESEEQLIKVYTSLPAYDDPSEPVG